MLLQSMVKHRTHTSYISVTEKCTEALLFDCWCRITFLTDCAACKSLNVICYSYSIIVGGCLCVLEMMITVEGTWESENIGYIYRSCSHRCSYAASILLEQRSRHCLFTHTWTNTQNMQAHRSTSLSLLLTLPLVTHSPTVSLSPVPDTCRGREEPSGREQPRADLWPVVCIGQPQPRGHPGPQPPGRGGWAICLLPPHRQPVWGAEAEVSLPAEYYETCRRLFEFLVFRDLCDTLPCIQWNFKKML